MYAASATPCGFNSLLLGEGDIAQTFSLKRRRWHGAVSATLFGFTFV